MKNSNQLVSRMIICMLGAISMLTTVSCSSMRGGADGTSVSLGKNGTVQSNIQESFEESYYDKDELQQMILTQAATYNRNAGSGSIAVEKVEVKDGVAVVQMTYAGARDYASFNKTVFFAGNAKEADQEGYELNVVLSGVKNPQETVGKADILAMEDETLLITDVSDTIKLSGKALYVSDNVTVSSDAKTVCRSSDSEGLAYIIFK